VSNKVYFTRYISTISITKLHRGTRTPEPARIPGAPRPPDGAERRGGGPEGDDRKSSTGEGSRHRSLKNILLLDNYYSPSELEAKIGQWVKYYNNRRYHEALGNITPSDMYDGKRNEIMKRRMEVKRRTIRLRRKVNELMVKEAAALGPAWK
jgi:hypothetical protein